MHVPECGVACADKDAEVQEQRQRCAELQQDLDELLLCLVRKTTCNASLLPFPSAPSTALLLCLYPLTNSPRHHPHHHHYQGQESRKATDLAEAMRVAGLDPEEVTDPIDEEYASMDIQGGGGEEEGGAGEEQKEEEEKELGEEEGWDGAV